MDLNNVNISDLNTDEIMKHLIPYVEGDRKIYAKFSKDDKPLIKYYPALEDGTDNYYDDYRHSGTFDYMLFYNYDEQRRLTIVMTLSKWAMNDQPTGWMYNSDVKYKYLGNNPKPAHITMSNGFWVANKFDKDYNLIQSVTSEGATLLQLFDEDGYLMTKIIRILTGNEYFEYKYTFGVDPTEFIQYEDSFGNFWDASAGYPCPFENPVKIQNKDFLEDHNIYFI